MTKMKLTVSLLTVKCRITIFDKTNTYFLAYIPVKQFMQHTDKLSFFFFLKDQYLLPFKDCKCLPLWRNWQTFILLISLRNLGSTLYLILRLHNVVKLTLHCCKILYFLHLDIFRFFFYLTVALKQFWWACYVKCLAWL